MDGLPIIRLELEGMTKAICAAFSNYQLQCDTQLKAAVEKFCEPSHLQRVLNDTVDHTLRDVIEKEVEAFFHYGKGRLVVKELVTKKLEEEYA